MIEEYAVEPLALRTWGDYRYLMEKFGVDQGRLIALFPANWKALVRDSLDCSDMQRARIVEALWQFVDSKLLPTGRPFREGRAWLENAELSQATEPFRAIIATANPHGADSVRLVSDLSDADPRWRTTRGCCIPRRADEMARIAGPLLRIGKIIQFIDPHFDPDKQRFSRPLSRFLDILGQRRRLPARIELHLDFDCNGTSRSVFIETCRRSFLRAMPRHLGLVVMRWRERDGGEKLHPRYILTEVGGLRFEHGLDEGRSGQTTDVELLTPEIHKTRWENYQVAGHPAFELVDQIDLP